MHADISELWQKYYAMEYRVDQNTAIIDECHNWVMTKVGDRCHTISLMRDTYNPHHNTCVYSVRTRKTKVSLKSSVDAQLISATSTRTAPCIFGSVPVHVFVQSTIPTDQLQRIARAQSSATMNASKNVIVHERSKSFEGPDKTTQALKDPIR